MSYDFEQRSVEQWAYQDGKTLRLVIGFSNNRINPADRQPRQSTCFACGAKEKCGALACPMNA